MKKIRINTTLRRSLENYVRSRINDGIDQTPLEDARRRQEAEALRLVQAAYPPQDMATLAKYGQSQRYNRLSFALPDGKEEMVEFAQALPHDLPESGGYRFDPRIAADAAFAAATAEVARIDAALRAEAKRQWKQAEVLGNCALYFEDVLDYLGIADGERVSLARRWCLPVTPAAPEAVADGGEEDELPTSVLIAAVEPVIAYAESEALALESHQDGEEAEAEAERAWQIVQTARAAIARARAA
jgi:hypothetical protein